MTCRPPRRAALGLPDRIALIRVHLGLSQRAFAARIGVTRNTVIAYEHGHTSPRASTLRRIAAAGGVTVEALRDGAAPRWLQDGAWEEAVACCGPCGRTPAGGRSSSGCSAR